MSLDEFWHGDMRLLDIYQKAYFRNVSYSAWAQGQYTFVAFSTAMANAFAKKGTPPKQYPAWVDPIEKLQKPKITKDNIEQEFRKSQAQQNGWLHALLNNK